MKRSIIGLVLVVAIVFVAPALAGNGPSKGVYATAGTKVQKVVTVTKGTRATAGVAGAKASGTLPFTGLDLGLMGGAGVLLVGTGLSLRLLTRERAAKRS